MLKLVKPLKEHKNKYIEMIAEWQSFGGPYVPCIVEYNCTNPLNTLSYNSLLDVVDNYRNGKIFDYDENYFKSSEFYFIFDEEELVGVCEIRNNLKPLGNKLKGHMACGIRPSKRNQGYALKVTNCMIEKLKESGVKEVVLCHNEENIIVPNVIKKLGFEYRETTTFKNGQKIKRYTKQIN